MRRRKDMHDECCKCDKPLKSSRKKLRICSECEVKQ